MDVLIKLFIKNSEDVTNDKVRGAYGTFSSVMGMVMNVILFGLKIFFGTLAGSVSIISDAFNNLSDAGSCVLTLVGYKLAAKPADKDHPFGHGRMEYLISLVVASIIMLVGVELLKTSANKIFNPEKLNFSWAAVTVLIFSILVKLWLALFNRKLGKKINSSVMIATSKDSLSDVLATLASLIALVGSLWLTIPLDGIMGVAVSIVVILAGFGIVKDTVDELLGKPADAELVSRIREILMADEHVLGVHDLIIHSYGPGVIFGSAHAEVSSSENILEVHDAIDELEKKVYDSQRVVLTVHMDPIENDNENVNILRQMLEEILLEIDSMLTFHDFRVVNGPTHTNLIFDVVIPFECKLDEKEIKKQLDEKLSKKDAIYYAVVNFDREYTQSR